MLRRMAVARVPRSVRGLSLTCHGAVALLIAFTMGGCLLDRGGLSDAPGEDAGIGDGGGTDSGARDAGCAPAAPVCNGEGNALEGCSGGEPTSMACAMGCATGASACWACTPSTAAPVCNAAGTSLDGCDAEGQQITDSCLSGCTPGETTCAPCVTGTVSCELAQVVSCVASAEQREDCVFACLDDGSPACTDCTPDASECHGAGPGAEAVLCNSDGTIQTAVSCPGGCELVGDTAQCACVPSCDSGLLDDCSGAAVVTCAFGCNGAGDGCGEILPSNVDAPGIDVGSAGISIGGSGDEWLVFFTGSGRIATVNPSTESFTGNLRDAGDDGGDAGSGIHYEVISQADGAPDLAVWVMDSLTVGTEGRIYFVGDEDDPAAVVLVEGDVLVEGEISASDFFLSGEGTRFYGPAGALGGNNGGDNPGEGTGGGDGGASKNGGGGGSFGTAGGNDGSGNEGGGSTYGNATLIPLRAGSGGGGSDDGDADGGRSGGALQITAGGTLTVAAGAVIDARGHGGEGADEHGGGGGGGSGGALLLEAGSISIAGVVGAPGGGGGGGRHNADGSRGGRWNPPDTLVCRGGDGGGGGRGADGSSPAGDVGTAGDNNSDSGGGGGGAGRIRLNAATTSAVTVTGMLTPSRSSSASLGVAASR